MLPHEQKGYRKESNGSEHHRLINRMITGNCHNPKTLTVQHGLITAKHLIIFLTLVSQNYREGLSYPENCV